MHYFRGRWFTEEDSKIDESRNAKKAFLVHALSFPSYPALMLSVFFFLCLSPLMYIYMADAIFEDIAL